MSPPAAGDFWVCPECGACLNPNTKSCWLCRWEGAGKTGETKATPTARSSAVDASVLADRQRAMQFNLVAIMVALTSAAVLLGVLLLSPGLGILLAVLLAPLVLRVCFHAAWGEESVRGSLSERIGTVATVLLGVFFGGFAMLIALFVICLASFGGGFR